MPELTLTVPRGVRNSVMADITKEFKGEVEVKITEKLWGEELLGEIVIYGAREVLERVKKWWDERKKKEDIAYR